jgi:uncharacterized membrane protein
MAQCFIAFTVSTMRELNLTLVTWLMAQGVFITFINCENLKFCVYLAVANIRLDGFKFAHF